LTFLNLKLALPPPPGQPANTSANPGGTRAQALIQGRPGLPVNLRTVTRRRIQVPVTVPARLAAAASGSRVGKGALTQSHCDTAGGSAAIQACAAPHGVYAQRRRPRRARQRDDPQRPGVRRRWARAGAPGPDAPPSVLSAATRAYAGAFVPTCPTRTAAWRAPRARLGERCRVPSAHPSHRDENDHQVRVITDPSYAP
jgi:hypothetical protein